MICGPPQMNGSILYTQSAAVLRLYARNFTNHSVNFGYEVMDQTLGFPIYSCVRCNATSATVVVPTGRNYTVMFVRDPEMFSPPGGNWSQCGNITQLQCPIPPISSSVTGLTAGNITTINQSLVINQYNITGCINVTGNNSAINITKIVPKLIPWPGFIPPMKAEISGGFNISDTDDLNYSDPRCPSSLAYYRLDVMGSTSGIEYFIEFYGKNASSDAGDPGSAFSVAAFQNFTINQSTSFNITLRRLAGVYATGGDVNISKVTVNLFKNTNNKTACNAADANCFALSNPHIEIEVKDSNIYNGQNVHYIVESISNGSFSMPFLNTSIVKISTFDQGTSPSEKTLNLSQNINNITIYSFMPDKILPNGTRTEFNKSVEGAMQNIRFYRSGGDCDVFNPPESCALEGGNFSGAGFDPMRAMLAGKSNLRITTPNVTIYLINVDLIASGPPEPDRSEQPLSGSSSLQSAWRFGSMAPKIYDQVLIGVTDPTINSSWSYNISIPVLFGENLTATPVWNLSAGDSLANVPEDYAEYNATNSAYRDFLTSAGMPCSFTNSSEECYINASENKTWLKIPHFSGIQPTITGLAPTVTTTTTTTTGGGGGGAAVSTTKVTLARGNANITVPSIAAGKMANVSITKYEDIAFRQINISVVNSVNNIKIVITKLAGLPASVTHEISGKTYHYIQIDKTNFTDIDVNKVFIKFAVNKTWLTNNGITNSNISLYRWANDKWNELATTYLNEDALEAFYQVESPGLSYFLIGTKGGEVVAAPTCTENWSCADWSTCVNNQQSRTCTDSNACGTTTNKPAESQSCVEEGKVAAKEISWIYYSIAAVILIAIAALLFVFRKKITPAFLKLTSKISKKKTI